jgi:hypothetical protein
MSSTKKASTGSTSRSRTGKKPTTEPTCELQFGRWIARGFTGCGFAQSFAKTKKLLVASLERLASAEEVDHVLDVGAAEHAPVAVVLPWIRDEHQLVEQLRALNRGSRWRVVREQLAELPTDDLLVRIEWTTPFGFVSMPMGFGPFPQMPVTRRAPYVCIATWPGEHENPHRKKFDKHRVDFLDAATAEPLTKQQYDTLWASSVERTTELLAETRDESRFYRTVSFRLSSSAELG